MKISCISCGTDLPASQLNVAADLAVCPNCDEAFQISPIVVTKAIDGDHPPVDLSRPPKGVWFEDMGFEWRLGATTRSPIAFFLVPFMCVWSGFSLGGLYGSQILEGEFDLFKSLFGIPFLIGTIVIGSIALMAVFGKTVVRVSGTEGEIFTGVGRFGWRRRFNWNEITRVEERLHLSVQPSGQIGKVITLIGPTELQFATMVNANRRRYMVEALCDMLRRRDRMESPRQYDRETGEFVRRAPRF